MLIPIKGGGIYDILGSDVGTKNPICPLWRPFFGIQAHRNTLKIGDYGAWTATSAVAVILAVITAAATVFVGF